MATEKTKKTDEAQIRQLVDNWAKALRAKDVDGLMANYALRHAVVRPRAPAAI